MRTSEFMMALNALCHERDLPKEIVIQAIETALLTAYRRDYGAVHNATVSLDPVTGEARVFVEKEVVEDVLEPRTEISLEEARRIDPNAKLGDVIKVEITPRDFGRIAAQTAKQVILQKIREAERDRVYTDFANREGEIVMGTVQSIDPNSKMVRLSLGRAEGLMPRQDQIPTERYRIGQRLRVYIYNVVRTPRGPQIYVSRTRREMLRRLLELEVPEIANGTVEIRAIAREPGMRSKVAVWSTHPGVDPVGACVGMKGIRIQNIVNELSGEKIDVVQWSPDEAQFVANALSPAKVLKVFLEPDHPEGKTAIVIVPDKQLSLAIGKEGQNARLAAKLTGWRIDIKSASEAAEEVLRLTEREMRRKAEEEARRREYEEKLAAARALLAEAEKAEKREEAAALQEEIEELEFEIEALTEEAPATEETAAQAEEAPAAETTATPSTEPAQPEAEVRAEPAPTVQPEPVVEQEPFDLEEEEEEEEFEDFEEEEEEEAAVARKSDKPSLLDLFYTLNERGEQVDLEDEIRARKKKSKKKKARRRRKDNNEEW